MVKKILWALLFSLIIIFLAVWIWSGGISKAKNQAGAFTNLIDFIFFHGTSTDATLRLPWQPEMPTGAGLPGGNDAGSNFLPAQDNSGPEGSDAKTFGSPSPYVGQVRIVSGGGVAGPTVSAEYLEISAVSANTAPINLKGWSVQSAYSGVRAYIPIAASPFLLGTVNSAGYIQLDPGQYAVLNSGFSPVGVSFRENICVGYLSQMQNFTPALSNTCPETASILPMTSDNLKAYGQACFDFLPSIPQCETPLNNIPPDVSPNCRAFAQDNLSYNGCVQRNRASSSFASNVWRIYLNASSKLWQQGHDIIRLLDSEGRTVDVMTY